MSEFIDVSIRARPIGRAIHLSGHFIGQRVDVSIRARPIGRAILADATPNALFADVSIRARPIGRAILYLRNTSWRKQIPALSRELVLNSQ